LIKKSAEDYLIAEGKIDSPTKVPGSLNKGLLMDNYQKQVINKIEKSTMIELREKVTIKQMKKLINQSK
jgi:hypothetical protein